MRRSGEEYERLDGLAREILVDYQVSSFPLDLLWLSKRMGFDVVPYSAYEGSANFPLLLKRSKDGFSYPAGIGKVPTIFYNDKYGDNLTPARIQSTIGHEIKHLIDGDEDDSEDDLCDHFARYLRCPIPYVIIKGYSTPTELISHFGISAEQAVNTLKQVRARVRFYGDRIFDNEKEFIDCILTSEE
ncbi:MAG: hypothetical protein IKE94_17035 [Aeriscardovia sp.]|nr:hypothetical protein [Aeriscardovia sp.]